MATDPGVVLENAVACGLLRELQFLEDTKEDRTSLCYLRDKEKREVDFLTLVEGVPQHLIEVKWKDDHFSPSLLYYFQKYFPQVDCLQLVHEFYKPRSSQGARIRPAHEFWKNSVSSSSKQSAVLLNENNWDTKNSWPPCKTHGTSCL